VPCAPSRCLAHPHPTPSSRRPSYRRGYTDGTGFTPVHIGSAGSDTQSDLGTLNLAGVPTVLIERGTMRHAADARCLR